MVTTDKVYANREWAYGYRESDRLGGHDPLQRQQGGRREFASSPAGARASAAARGTKILIYLSRLRGRVMLLVVEIGHPIA